MIRQTFVLQYRIHSRRLLIIEQECQTGENHMPIKWGYTLLCFRQKQTDRIKHENTLLHPWYLRQKPEVGCAWHLCVATDQHACTQETKHNFVKTRPETKACFFMRCPQIDEIRSQPAMSSARTQTWPDPLPKNWLDQTRHGKFSQKHVHSPFRLIIIYYTWLLRQRRFGLPRSCPARNLCRFSYLKQGFPRAAVWDSPWF